MVSEDPTVAGGRHEREALVMDLGRKQGIQLNPTVPLPGPRLTPLPGKQGPAAEATPKRTVQFRFLLPPPACAFGVTTCDFALSIVKQEQKRTISFN